MQLHDPEGQSTTRSPVSAAAAAAPVTNKCAMLRGGWGAAMKRRGKMNRVAGGAAILAALCAVMPQASGADLLKVAAAQRGAWESAAPELGQSAGIFSKHGITLDVVYTREGEAESSVASGSSDVGIGVGTVGVLRAYGKGAPLRVIGASTTGTANYWYVQAASVIKAVKDINGKTI